MHNKIRKLYYAMFLEKEQEQEQNRQKLRHKKR